MAKKTAKKPAAKKPAAAKPAAKKPAAAKSRTPKRGTGSMAAVGAEMTRLGQAAKKAGIGGATTTNRPPLKVPRGGKKGSGGGRFTPTNIGGYSGLGKGEKPLTRKLPDGTQQYTQRKVKLFIAGNRKKPTGQAARKGSQIFLDRNGKRVSMDKAATKGGNLRKGFTMVLGEGTRNRATVTAGESE